jgi:hypothetical protein
MIENKCRANTKKTPKRLSTFTLLALVFCLMAVILAPAAAFAATVTLTAPADKATGVALTNIAFTWQKFSDNTTDYFIDVSLAETFTVSLDLPNNGQVSGSKNTFTYSGTFQPSTKYYWRVMALSPEMSEWSKTYSFTTGTGQTQTPPPATTTTTTSTNTTTPTATATPPPVTTTTPPPSNSGIGGFINDVGWPLIIGMAVVLIVIIVLVIALLSRPKKGPTMAGGGYGGPGPNRSGPGAVNACITCGFVNSPDRKFCANCGNSLGMEPQFQQAPPPQVPPRMAGGPQYQPPRQNMGYGQTPPPPPPPSHVYGAGYGAGTICPNCGFANQPGKQFCGSCGSRLMPPMPPQQPPMQPPVQQPPIQQPPMQQQAGYYQPPQQQQQTQRMQQMYCPTCGAPGLPGRQFCASCGGTLVGGTQQVVGTYQTFMCPICGATMQKGNNPCPSCHTWLDWGS